MNLIKGGKPITPTGDPSNGNGSIVINGNGLTLENNNGTTTVVDGATKVEVRLIRQSESELEERQLNPCHFISRLHN